MASHRVRKLNSRAEGSEESCSQRKGAWEWELEGGEQLAHMVAGSHQEGTASAHCHQSFRVALLSSSSSSCLCSESRLCLAFALLGWF